MIILPIMIIIEIVLVFALRSFGLITGMNYSLFVLLNTMITIILICKNNQMNQSSKIILVLALLARIFLIFMDNFIMKIPFNTTDAINFDKTAKRIVNNPNILKESVIYGGIYSKFLGVLYISMGESAMFAKSINALFAVASIYLIFQMINQCAFKNEKIKNLLKIFVALWPLNIIYSISLIRESAVVFFIVASLKYCFDYINTNKISKILLTFSSTLIATMLHSANIFLLLGYILIFSFFEYKEQKVNISRKNIVKFVIVTVIFILIFIRFPNLFTEKLTRKLVDNQQNITIEQNGNFIFNKIVAILTRDSDAGSSYLTARTVNNMWEAIILAFQKVIYFLMSPMPWNWRNFADVIAFFGDSMIYLGLGISIVMSFRKMNQTKVILLLFVMSGLALVIAIFAMGTFTAGTAIRHRNQLLYYILILSIIGNTKKVRSLDNA